MLLLIFFHLQEFHSMENLNSRVADDAFLDVQNYISQMTAEMLHFWMFQVSPPGLNERASILFLYDGLAGFLHFIILHESKVKNNHPTK